MSRRKGFALKVGMPVEPQTSPYQQVSEITCEVRVYWPNNATQEDVQRVIMRATAEAFKRYEQESA